MKKLLIAVSAAACALGAFAALEQDFISKVTFEESGYTVGESLVVTNDDYGAAAVDSGKGQWYSASPADVDATVTAYATAPEEGNTNYLNIESTGKPLYRLIHGMATPDVAATNETMGTVYIDTKVQFTAGDPDMTSDEDGAKLALWVCGNDENGDPASETNFTVKAGCFVDGKFTNAVYTMAADGVTFEKDAWYRLTVKSYANVGVNDGQTYQGFVVFVGGVALTPVNYDLPDWVTVPTEEFGAGLLLSMVANDNTLAAVGFSGTGAIDDVTFTASAPEFAADAQFFTVAWTNGVASIAFGSDTNITCTSDVGSALLPLAFATNDVTVTYQTGYVAGDWKKGDIEAGDTLTIKGILATCSYEDGEGNTVYVATLADAIAAANGTTVTLTADIPAGDPISVTNTVIIDLAGRTLNCGFTVTTGGSLTINDTIGDGAVVAESVIVYEAGNITLNAGKYTGAILFDGDEYTGTFTIANGTKFKDYDDGDPLAGLIDGETQQLSGLDEDGFVTVQAKQSTVTPIVPGSVSTPMTEAEANALVANDDVSDYIALPADDDADDISEEDAATYKALFKLEKNPAADGKYTVTPVLKPASEAAIKEDLDAADVAPAEVAAGEKTEATISTAKPGIYYSIEVADNLSFTGIDGQNVKEGKRKMATSTTGPTVAIPALENANGNARFFRVKANIQGN